ncbi:MAG: fasciclin domain-containing protein [Pseudomonadota bacterium]
MEGDTIVDVVLDVSGAEGFDDNAGDFDILREALIATDLVGALADTNADLSVFAPTDGAFIQLARDLGADVADGDEAGALTAIIDATTALAGSAQAGLDLIADILLYHVAAGAKTLEELGAAGPIETLNGETVEVNGTTVVDKEPDLISAEVVLEDVETINGTIQAIDQVLLPLDLPGNEPPADNIVAVASGDDRFDILVQAVVAAGLAETLLLASDLTVFAPTDGAFAALAADLGYNGSPFDEAAVLNFIVAGLTELGDGDPIPLLQDILLYHVAPGAQTAAELDAAGEIGNLNGAALSIDGTELTDIAGEFANPNIVVPDVAAADNLIQAIDRVLLPVDLPALPPVRGGAEDDVLRGGNADNVLRGGGGNDQIAAGRGDDLAMGGRGDDDIRGQLGNDTLKGGAGNDNLNGGAGADLLQGGGGDDMLRGGIGPDTLKGGMGDDTLIGGKGGDMLMGGAGADRLVFTNLQGRDRVMGVDEDDRIVMSSDDFADIGELLAAAEQRHGNLVVKTEDGAVIFQNADTSIVDEATFLFV